MSVATPFLQISQKNSFICNKVIIFAALIPKKRLKMKKTFGLMACVLFVACGGGNGNSDTDDLTLTSKFNSTWNIHESIEQNRDGSIIYHALPFGGLIGTMKERNLPVDWSAYEAITVEFAEPTKAETQLLVADRYKAWGKVGITSLRCSFDGQDVTSIDEVTLQAADSTVLIVKDVRLTPVTGIWKATPLRTLNCEFGNWENGFTLLPELFADALSGDKLEFLYTTDTSNPEIGDWLIKTVFYGTDTALEGNKNELNKWKCAPVGKRSSLYRITLTDKDINELKKKGLFVNGRYVNVTQCNLLRNEEDMDVPEEPAF